MDYPNRRRLKIYAHAELRDLAEFYYWTRKLQAHFFAGDLVSAVHASLRAVPLLWTSNSFFSSDDSEATPPAIVDRLDIRSNGMMTRAPPAA